MTAAMEMRRERLPELLKTNYHEPLRHKYSRLNPKANPYATVQTISASTSHSIGRAIAPDFIYEAGPVLSKKRIK